MGWKSYCVFLGVAFVVLGLPMLAVLTDIPFTHMMIVGLGGAMILGGVMMVGVGMGVSNETTCPHCQQKSDLEIGFWNSKPTLVKRG